MKFNLFGRKRPRHPEDARAYGYGVMHRVGISRRMSPPLPSCATPDEPSMCWSLAERFQHTISMESGWSSDHLLRCLLEDVDDLFLDIRNTCVATSQWDTRDERATSHAMIAACEYIWSAIRLPVAYCHVKVTSAEAMARLDADYEGRRSKA